MAHFSLLLSMGEEGNEKVESKSSCCGHYEFPELGDNHGFPFHDLGICHEVPMPLTRITHLQIGELDQTLSGVPCSGVVCDLVTN